MSQPAYRAISIQSRLSWEIVDGTRVIATCSSEEEAASIVSAMGGGTLPRNFPQSREDREPPQRMTAAKVRARRVTRLNPEPIE